MQFGLQSPIFSPADGLSPSESFAFQSRFYQTALRSGFDCVSTGNHFVEGPEVTLFQPLVTAAYIMAKWPSLYVMTSVLCLPYYKPVALAQEIATLDAISPGAFLFGVGQGYRRNEADALGIEQTSRGRRLAESIAACRLLWKDPHTTFDGEFCRFDDADIGFRPANGAGPPILVAADRLRTVARVPEIGGDHWLPSPRHGISFLREALDVYQRALENAGREFVGIPVQRDVSIAATQAEAESAIRESYETTMQHQHQHGQPQPGAQNDRPFDELKDERLLIGPPAQIAARIVDLHDELHAPYLHLRVHTVGAPLERSLETIEQLGEEVLPLVRQAVTGANLFPDRRSQVKAAI